MKVKKTLEELEEDIRSQVSNWGAFSRNIVGICLRQVDSAYGTKEANKLVRKYKLVKYGFNEEREE